MMNLNYGAFEKIYISKILLIVWVLGHFVWISHHGHYINIIIFSKLSLLFHYFTLFCDAHVDKLSSFYRFGKVESIRAISSGGDD